MAITRINTYEDPRFSPRVLMQHGAFLLDDSVPCEAEIISHDTAILRCPDHAVDTLIEEFRFYAEHISRFMDENGHLLRCVAPVARFRIEISTIQPSQFYVDADKLHAVQSFLHQEEDIVIPLISYNDRYVSLDGHTRLYAAQTLELTHVYGFLTQADTSILAFVQEAQRRGIYSPADITLLPHEEYRIRWDGFCDAFFARNQA